MPDADNESPAPTFCALCFTRRAVAVEGAGPPFCIKCIDASNKRYAGAAWPTDPALQWGIIQALGMR
jgi:hypothetical protein